MLARLLLLFLLPIANVYATERLPLEYFAKLPRFSDPVLSPDGKRLASVAVVDGKPILLVQPIAFNGEMLDQQPTYSEVGKYYFSSYEWLNNTRLGVTIRVTTGLRGHLWNLTRLVFIGSDGAPLVAPNFKANNNGYYRQHASILDRLPHDDEHVLALLDNDPDIWAAPMVHKVNVYTGKRFLFERNRKGNQSWIVDNTGIPRIAVKKGTDNTKTHTYYRQAKKEKWQLLQKIDYFDKDRIEAYRFDKNDNNILLVTTANLEDEQIIDESTTRLFRYDLSTQEILGEYKDERLIAMKKLVRKGVGDDVNIDLVSYNDAKTNFIFRVYGDTRAPRYYYLDTLTPAFSPLGDEYPELAEQKLATVEVLNYDARDGLNIPAFLTVPHGVKKEKLPLVVMPHGGPWSHDEWGFDNYAQFFANRGYAVFQPQFRGSTGYGSQHLKAGYGQWGGAIQDDISDGVQWLIKQGIVDANRICIVGGSFGGYAAAMGVAATPDLYQCAVSINGVLDLVQHIDSADKLLYEDINRAIWNKRKTAKEFSPYHLAKHIKAPLLLMAAKKDTVVSYKHSKKMYKRLKKLKKPVEYIEFKEGEHYRTHEANELQKFKAMEAFIDEHIGDKA